MKKTLKREKKVKKEKREEIKLDKINTYLNISVLLLIAFFILNSLVMHFSFSYSRFFCQYIINSINGLFYFLNGHISYLSIVLYICYFAFILFYLVFDIYYEYFSKKDYIERAKKVNSLYRIFFIYTLIIILPAYFSQFLNHLPNFDQLYFSKTQDKTYTKEDLIDLDVYLQEQIEALSATFPRNKKNDIDVDINYNKVAVDNLKNISSYIPLLKGLYPTKSSKINNLMRSFLGSKVAGFTTPYNTYFDYDASKISTLNTITHEFCHTKGIVRENEAVYCSFLAGIKSDNDFSKYAAYIEAFSWTTEALSSLDYDTADKIEDELLSQCLTNNYSELCENYTKNIDGYIPGAKYLFIASYRLKNYVGYEDKLKDSLEILLKNNAKLIINDKEVTIEEVMKKIKDASEERLSIGLKINSSIFNKIQPAIEDIRLYVSVYQKNKDDKESKEKLKNPAKYYLAPFKTRDEHLFINLSYASVEYEYSRVARLLLEYYDNKNIK